MYAVLMFVHILVCLFLVVVVLLQPGRGGIGPSMGGGNQVFGGAGAGNVLTRATTAFAGIFMVTSISLAYLSSSGNSDLKARAEERKKAHADSMGVSTKAAADDARGAAGTEGPSAPPASK